MKIFFWSSVYFSASGKSSAGTILPFQPHPPCPHITLTSWQ